MRRVLAVIGLTVLLGWQLVDSVFGACSEVVHRQRTGVFASEGDRIRTYFHRFGPDYDEIANRVRAVVPAGAYVVCKPAAPREVMLSLRQILYPRLVVELAEFTKRWKERSLDAGRRVFFLELTTTPGMPHALAGDIVLCERSPHFAIYEYTGRHR